MASLPEWHDEPFRINAAAAARGRTLPSPAELRALECVSRGLTAQMTADVLGKARNTVEKQLATAVYVLRAKNRTHAVAEAIRRDLIR